jgi:hypothetical protein
MSRRGALATIVIVVSAAGAGIALSAAGAGEQRLSIAAATFVPVTESTHNNAGDSVCAAFVPAEPGSENRGDLNAKKGSFLAPVHIPDGSKVQDFSVFANDNDGDDGVHAFLVRKLLKNGLAPQFGGYHVMAAAASKGAVLNTMRKFTDSSVTSGLIDDARFMYYVEMVNCVTTEPFAVQIGFTK